GSCGRACAEDPLRALSFHDAFPGAAPRPRSAPGLLELRVELQPPERIFPHALERGGDGTERRAPRAVEAVFVVAAALDETGFAERAQLQRHGAEGDVGHRGMNVPGGQLAAPYEPQDLAPAWRRDGGKDGRGMLHVCEFRSN